MKKFILVLLAVSVLSFSSLFAQDKNDFKPSGKAFAKVYFNYHFNMTDGTTQSNSFAIKRTYLGYKYKFSKDISTKITLDAAGNSSASKYTAYLKTAQLDWKMSDKVKLSLGLIGMKQFDTQEHFWGYRYVFKSFQDEFGFGSSADLGVNAEIGVTKTLKANVFVNNGEGYKKVQDDNGRMKTGANVIFMPIEGLTLKGYFDVYSGKLNVNGVDRDTSAIQTYAFFAGYKMKNFRIAAEYNLQMNGKKYSQQAKDYNLTGLSFYGTYVINKKFEVFANYMNLSSNKLDGQTDNWNYNKDGSLILVGGQYNVVKGVKMALNYQTFAHDNSDINTSNLLYVNFEYKF